MNRRMIFLASAAVAINVALPRTVYADQAILVHDARFELSPGESVEHTDTIIVSRYGIPTVVFDGSSGFADNETVVATITVSARNGIGTVELLSPSTITGTTGPLWTTPDSTSSEIWFDPPISVRYTAPSSTALECDDRPENVIHTSLAIGGTLVGSAGTKASFSGDSFPGVVMYDILCPAIAYEEAPTLTAMPTPTPAKETAAVVASPSPSPTPTPTPIPSPTRTSPVASVTASPTSIVMAIDPSPGTTVAPAPTLAADMTPTAISLGVVTVVLVIGLATWLVWRRRSA